TEDVEAGQLLFGLRDRPVEDRALARAAQGARAGRAAEPRRRPELSVLPDPAVRRAEAGHQGRIFLLCPGHDVGFDMIGEQGIEHQGILVRWTDGLPRTFGPRGNRQRRMMEAGGASGEWRYQIKTRREGSRRVPIVELAGQAPGAPSKPDQPVRRSQRGDSACDKTLDHLLSLLVGVLL